MCITLQRIKNCNDYRFEPMKTTQEYLAGYGIHPSQQRLAIMNYLMNHRTHPTAEEIFTSLNNSMPTLSKTTIYNTLRLFAEKGAVQMVTVDEKNAHYDADCTPHAHFFCLRCNTIYDIPLPDHIEDAHEFFGNNPHLKDFTIQDTQIFYKGTCPLCKTSEK